jgi:hypothetical protein
MYEIAQNNKIRNSRISDHFTSENEYNTTHADGAINTDSFGGAPRAGSSMVYNKCVFCGEIYATNAKGVVCGKCTVIFSWASGMNYLAAVNRVSELIKTNKLDSKLRNENYCKSNFGVHATQVIMDAVDSSKR